MVSSSPGLTVAPSQNTAAVVRFRCLYTHDLRRKAKRWQDGYLRYHTFNKRIMVFDEPGNFIGDKHWRQDEMIQDGDEIELDKGVLVQVAESMEKTETDLTPLFETRKASQGSPSQPSASQQARRVPVRPAVPSSQQSSSSQSRSLNDLLGIKKTPVERLKSPYEQRQSAAPRPAAKQVIFDLSQERPAPEKPTERQIPKNPVAQERPAPKEKPAERQVPKEKPAPKKPVAQERPVPKEKPAERHVPKETQAPKEKPAPKETQAPKPVAQERPLPKDNQPVVIDLSEPSVNDEPPKAHSPTVQAPPRKARKTLPHISKPDHKSHSFSGNPQLPVSSPAAPSSTAPSGPRSTLQLAKSKPRKKLMYQALLPGQKKTPNPSSTNAESQRGLESTNSPGTSTLDALAGNETNSMSTNSMNPDNSTLEALANETDSGDDNPVSADIMALDSPTLDTSTNNEPAPASDNPNNSTLNPPDNGPIVVDDDDQFDTLDIGNSTLDILVNNEPDDTDDNPMPTDAMVPGASTQNILADMADDSISDSDSGHEHGSPKNQPFQRNLQKAYSDPSAFITGSTSMTRTLSPCPEDPASHVHDKNQNQVQDQGPWTCEAMDLFDFWPPGRSKQTA